MHPGFHPDDEVDRQHSVCQPKRLVVHFMDRGVNIQAGSEKTK
jgi:hypothetical protein